MYSYSVYVYVYAAHMCINVYTYIFIYAHNIYIVYRMYMNKQYYMQYAEHTYSKCIVCISTYIIVYTYIYIHDYMCVVYKFI